MWICQARVSGCCGESLAHVPGPPEVPRVIGCTQQQGDRVTKNGFIVTKSGPEQENTSVG